MTSTNEPSKWYMVVYTSKNENGSCSGKTMDVLGTDWGNAARVAEDVMEPGEEIMSMGLMGTVEDYETYESYLFKREQSKLNQQALMSAVRGDENEIGTIRVDSVPFSDDDVIELT